MKHKGLFWGIMGATIIVGGVLIVLGMAMGGQLGNVSNIVDFGVVHAGRNYVTSSETALENSQEICNLDFNLAAGDITITTGDEFAVSGSKIYSEIRDDGKTWYLESPKRKWYHFLSNRGGGDWKITIPKDRQFEMVNLKFAAADLDVDDLWAKDLTIHGGAGDANIQHLQVDSSMDLKIAAGEITIESGNVAGDSRLDCGAGQMDMTLNGLLDNLDANCGMGQIEMKLPGRRENYQIDSQASMGSIEIDGEKHDRHDEEHDKRGEDDKVWATLNLTCGMGQITVDFD